ncbi:hypothetical protein ESCAB7627_3740 [Escherichia albertii TW07627]|uniref:Uncharacterized protein n=1 Tax=Escherichia albertii (strain TW07627) TaxID=502347 RepID=A0ABC9NLF9_ESCAT|nr:hypothetical protein ESCAB7627_3740 [Escherichia albertii TW07627]
MSLNEALSVLGYGKRNLQKSLIFCVSLARVAYVQQEKPPAFNYTHPIYLFM